MKRRLFAAALTAALLSAMPLPCAALSVSEARELLEEHYVDDLPPAAYKAGSLDELLETLGDPFTVYYTQTEYEKFLQSVNGEELVGIGVSVQNAFHDGFEILSILPGSPALEAGLLPGEKIIAVDGIPLTASDIPSARITGQEGTTVIITLRAPDGTVRDVTLTRRRVLVPIVSHTQVGSAGVITCDSFGESTSDAVRAAITEMNPDTTVWVMDLRDNPGGTADSAAKTAGAFLGKRPMVMFRDGAGTYFQTSTTKNSVDLTDKPLIVLTTRRSASASELFSAAIRDHRGGIAIGERTYGKGVAQKIYGHDKYPELFESDALKITTYRFFSPRGATNHLIGVIPTLLISQNHVETAARILSAPVPRTALYAWKLQIGIHTFYLDEELCRESPAAFTALLEALPPSATLSYGVGPTEWMAFSPAQVAQRFELTDYTPRTFSDVQGYPYQREIDTLSTYDLLSGDENGLFRPDDLLTRGQLAAMLTAALNLPAADAPYTDVSPDAWYADAVGAMTARGFMSGTGNGMFAPDAPVTNQEFYTVLSTVAAWAHMDGYEWAQKDISAAQWGRFYEYPEWAQSHVRNLDELGLSVEAEQPRKTVTRGQAAGMLCSLLENLDILWNE